MAQEVRRPAVDHDGDDDMSYLTAHLPSHIAAAIDQRLNREAAAFRHDDRTKAAIGADIAVVLSAETLVGLCDAPAVASDGSFVVPAAWMLDASTNPFWHQLLIDSSGNVLEHVFLGRFAPENLDEAMWFRGGTCQAPTSSSSTPRPECCRGG